MKLQIKQLKGETLEVEISENNKIAELKQIISKSTKVPASQLTLLHVGKTLLDDKLIDTYPTIKDGTKLNLVIKKPEPLNDVLIKFLSKWYTKEQCIKITDAFMKVIIHSHT